MSLPIDEPTTESRFDYTTRKFGDNIIQYPSNNNLPYEVKVLLSGANLPKTLKDKQDEDGMVRIETSDKIYEITYVRIIPPSDCMEEYKK